MAAKHPEIRVKFEVAGDDFRVVDHVTKEMRRAGVRPEEIEELFRQKTATSCGYADGG